MILSIASSHLVETRHINNVNTGCFNMGTGYICDKYLGAMPGDVITCSIQIGIDYSQGIAIFVD